MENRPENAQKWIYLFIYLIAKVCTHEFFSAKRPRKLIPATVFEAIRRPRNFVPGVPYATCVSLGAFIRWGFYPLGLLSVGLFSAGHLSVGLLSARLLSAHHLPCGNIWHSFQINNINFDTAVVATLGEVCGCSKLSSAKNTTGGSWHMIIILSIVSYDIPAFREIGLGYAAIETFCG